MARRSQERKVHLPAPASAWATRRSVLTHRQRLSRDHFCPWCRTFPDAMENFLLQCPRFHPQHTALHSRLSALAITTLDLPTLLVASVVHPSWQPAVLRLTCAFLISQSRERAQGTSAIVRLRLGHTTLSAHLHCLRLSRDSFCPWCRTTLRPWNIPYFSAHASTLNTLHYASALAITTLDLPTLLAASGVHRSWQLVVLRLTCAFLTTHIGLSQGS
ncbi:hypothetical protein E2C01_034994 [Portunus trituberculatus]|uniref:Uncharacterized protein n=1 Tax=Portunus trituberculatus TaxID=210409 RepID=A0A5B7FAA1_PORTR|nr:hypothetical protein [Portunus trituberculatus]